MPNTKSAVKALRQNKRRHERNVERKKLLKSTVKTFKKTAESGDAKAAQEQLQKVYEVADKIAKTGYIKKNKASRIKSRAAKLLARETKSSSK